MAIPDLIGHIDKRGVTIHVIDAAGFENLKDQNITWYTTASNTFFDVDIATTYLPVTENKIRK